MTCSNHPAEDHVPPIQPIIFRGPMVNWRRSPIFLVAAALAVGASACANSTQNADLENGKRLFTGEIPKNAKPTMKYQPCGACHALARANTKSTAGPDLDAAFMAARRDGMTEQTIDGIVKHQIGFPRRNSAMPADLVTGDDASDVAAYIASVAGEPGEDQGQLASIGAPVNSKPIPAKNGVLEMDANPQGKLAFASTMANAPAGPLQIVMKNPSSLQHDISIQGGGKGPVVGQGGTSRFTANLKPGKYTYLCTVPGHADGGMKGTLTVK
jgi:mono/diheme cytochrome c family protein